MAIQRRFFSQDTLGGSTVSDSPRPLPPRGDEFGQLATRSKLSDAEKNKLCYYLKNDYSAKLKTLTQLQRYLDQLSPRKQKSHLEDTTARGSYVYLTKVAQDTLLPEDTFMHRLWLYAKAREHHLPGYPFQVIQNLVDELCMSGIGLPSRSSLINILRTILYPAPDTDIREHMQLVQKLLRNVEERATHQPLIASDVITALIKGLSAHTRDTEERDRAQNALYQLLVRSGVRCPNQEELITLLDVFSSQGNWEGFWQIWSLPPLYGVPRTPKMFTFLFRRIAETKHQLNCQKALRRCVEELVVQRPQISLVQYPQLTEAAMACARVADPNAEAVLEEVERMQRSQMTKVLKRRMTGEFVLLMAQLKEKRLFDSKGPPRERNQVGPSHNLPTRNRMAIKRTERKNRRKKFLGQTDSWVPANFELEGR